MFVRASYEAAKGVAANQEQCVKNTYMLRASRLQHLFVRTLPLPLPGKQPYLPLKKQQLVFACKIGGCCFSSSHYPQYHPQAL